MFDRKYQRLYRFSKKVGVPQDQLDHVLVELLSQGSQGSFDNLKIIYGTLHKFRVLQQAAKDSNTSFREILDWMESRKKS